MGSVPESAKDRRNQWVVGIATVVTIALVALLVVQSFWNHHMSTQLQQQLLQRDQQIVQLTQQAKQKASQAALALIWAQDIDRDLTTICTAVANSASCASFPNFGALSSGTTQTIPPPSAAPSPARPTPAPGASQPPVPRIAPVTTTTCPKKKCKK